MRFILSIGVATLVTMASAQSPGPPPSDSRLRVATLVREDIFAGFLEGDMERFSKGEQKIELLLKVRPYEKRDLLAWKGGATLYRAILAFEGNRTEEFREKYREALDLYQEARKLGPKDFGVAAAIGGAYVVLADRLPVEYRGAAWSQAYDAYRLLWKQQASVVAKLPVHHRGELLGGLAQSAQRIGRTRESTEYVDKILALLPDTPYVSIAKKWKEAPETAAKSSLTCLSCHAPGRLAARRASLDKR
jgi:tetratricopeptide (TPR) repeat protein